MAHLDKYDRKQLRKISRETYRELEQDKYKNYVDSTRTNLNYSMKGYKTSKEFIDALDDRTQNIVDHDMDGKPPRNDPKYGSWVITCPEQLQGDPAKVKKFFELFYDFTGERYGRKNLIDCVVHMDETSPHATAYVVPACVSRKSGKKSISAATVFSLKDMKTFHHDFNKVCEKEFGIANLIMRTDEEREQDPRDLSLKDYKQEQEQRKQEAEQEAAGIVEQAKQEAATIKAKAKQEAAGIISEAEQQAAEIVRAAGEAKQATPATPPQTEVNRKELEEAKQAITTLTGQNSKLRQVAQYWRQEAGRRFDLSIEDEMILYEVGGGNCSDDPLKNMRSFYVNMYQKNHANGEADAPRVQAAKEAAARKLPDLSGIKQAATPQTAQFGT